MAGAERESEERMTTSRCREANSRPGRTLALLVGYYLYTLDAAPDRGGAAAFAPLRPPTAGRCGLDRSRGPPSLVVVADARPSTTMRPTTSLWGSAPPASASAADATTTRRDGGGGGAGTSNRNGGGGGEYRRRRNATRRRRRGSNANKGNNPGRELEGEIRRLGRQGKTDDALRLYSDLWPVGTTRTRPTTRLMNAAIDACARARPPRLHEAFVLFRDGVGVGGEGGLVLKPNVFTFGSLMSACARARDSGAALELLGSMQEDYHVRPNAVVYSTAMSACERSIPPKPHTALKLLREATSDPTVEMTVVGYNTVISALARCGDWQAAVDILRSMETGILGVGRGEADDDEGRKNHGSKQKVNASVIPRPDDVTYGTVMTACERAGQWEEVLRHAKTVEEDDRLRLDGQSLSTALNACQHLGLADKAMQYLEVMKGLGGGLDGDVDGVGDFAMARRTRGRERSGVRQAMTGPDEVAYGMAISACSRGGRWTDGLKLLEEMKTMGMGASVMAYTAAINGCAEVGQWRVAFQMLEDMDKEGVTPNVLTYSAVISACAAASAAVTDDDEKLKPMSAALAVLKQMKSAGVEPNVVTFNAAIKACAEGMHLNGAFRLLTKLKENGEVPTAVTFGSLMTACERVGDVEAAGRVFTLMKEDGVEPNEVVYGAAISCCRKAGAAEKAYLLLQKMVKDGLSPNAATFNTAMIALVEGKELDKALRLFKLMESKHTGQKPNYISYAILVRAFADEKKADSAELLLRAMKLRGYEPQVDLYTSVVTSYERAKQPMKALRLMEQMRKDGFNFYEVKVLDLAFKKAVSLVNQVGKGLSRSEDQSLNRGSKTSDPLQ